MLNRICIMPQQGCKGLSNARIKSAFKNVFDQTPVMIRTEGRNIIVHTSLPLKDKKVLRFAKQLGNCYDFQGKNDSYSFKL